MSEEKEPEIEIYQSNTFEKAFNRLTEKQKDLVDGEIDKIAEDPEIGTQKKGDLSYLWVHKFELNNEQVLLGYNWNEEGLTIHLLNIGPHENFYRAAKNRRKADLRLIS